MVRGCLFLPAQHHRRHAVCCVAEGSRTCVGALSRVGCKARVGSGVKRTIMIWHSAHAGEYYGACCQNTCLLCLYVCGCVDLTDNTACTFSTCRP